MTAISNNDDVLDVRDIITRVEELENNVEDGVELDEDEDAELVSLHQLLDEMKGYGGDHQWRGSWYPVTLVRDSYFEDHARELADDLGLINNKVSWPYTCIDWEKAATELQIDYSSVEFDGVTYWYR